MDGFLVNAAVVEKALLVERGLAIVVVTPKASETEQEFIQHTSTTSKVANWKERIVVILISI